MVVLVLVVLLFLVVVEVDEVVLAGSHALHDEDGSQVVEDLEVVVDLVVDLEVVAEVEELVVLELDEDQPSHPWAEARPAMAATTETEYFISTVIKKIELL